MPDPPAQQLPGWAGRLPKHSPGGIQYPPAVRRDPWDAPVDGDGVAFMQRSGRDLSTVTCYSCHQTGHYANSPECPTIRAIPIQLGTTTVCHLVEMESMH